MVLDILDRPRRAISPAHFLRPDTPLILRVEQWGQTLRFLQTEGADPITRRHAVGAATESTAVAIRDTAEWFRQQHGDQAEQTIAEHILEAVGRLPASAQLAFWSSVRFAMAEPSECDTTAQAVAVHLRAALGEAAEAFVRQRWAAVIREQARAGRMAKTGRLFLQPEGREVSG